ncbi:GNAT family N-acetyltransferase [Halorientalis pallida]|nr:GNAT family N-acetyltransferase [Halorientalis pallida]
MEPTTTTPGEGEYAIRPFAAGDGERFRDLYQTVWGHERSAEWFDWRFRQNPAADGVRMTLAERGRTVVGAEAAVPYRLGVGGETVRALQPVDWIVHPDHRGSGLATRMTEARIARDGDAELYFNFPTPALRPLLEKFGWRTVARPTTYYRVQDPAAIAARRGDGRAARLAGRLCAPLVTGYLDYRDRHVTPPDDIAVERLDGVPTATLAALYQQAVPERIHVRRTEAFLDWRFSNPNWNCRTYLARRDGRLVGSLVTCTDTITGMTTTRLADALPLVGGSDDAFAALVSAVVTDTPAAAVLTATADPIPDAVLSSCGFVADDTVTLSRLVSRTTHVARPVPSTESEEDWRLGGTAIDDGENWLLSLSDQDIA